MTKIEQWWSQRSAAEKWVVRTVGVAVVVATGGAAAYAIWTGGAIVVIGDTVVAIGAAAVVVGRARS